MLCLFHFLLTAISNRFSRSLSSPSVAAAAAAAATAATAATATAAAATAAAAAAAAAAAVVAGVLLLFAYTSTHMPKTLCSIDRSVLFE